MKRALSVLVLLLVSLSIAAEQKASVARIWQGRVPRARADEYQKYLNESGVQKLRQIKDNLGAEMFRRDEGDVSEFMVISYWPNRDAIHAYAGADIEKVHELPRDREFLIDPPGTLRHFDIIPTAPPLKVWKNADPAVDCAEASDKTLCAQLLALRDRDQQVRYAQLNKTATDADVRKVDIANLAELDSIVTTRGWPTKAAAGVKGAGGAWTIVQHSDKETRARYRPILEKAMKSGDVSPGLYATYLDRVLVDEGKPQIYGSQFHEVNGELVPQPIEDEAHVDERRKAMGLQPLAEYTKLLREMNGKK